MATKRLSDGSSIKNSYKLSRGATSAAKPEAPTIGAATKTGSSTATVAYTAATLGALGSTFTATFKKYDKDLVTKTHEIQNKMDAFKPRTL